MAITDGGGTLVVHGPSDLGQDWLQEVLGRAGVLPEQARISGHSTTRIGAGLMSESHRVALHYADDGPTGPDTVVLKVAASDPTSRSTGVALGAYAREVRFYRDVAPTLGDPVPACFDAGIERETGWFSLLLEDIAPARQGDEVVGTTVADAAAAIESLARIHAARWEDVALRSTRWLNAESPLNQTLLSGLLPGFVERYEDRLAAEHVAVAERLVPCLDAWAADTSGPQALQHGDYRLDNLLFADRASRPVVAVDWQTVFYGPALHDAAYFLGCSLRVEDRRAHGEALVRRYHEALLAAGVHDLSWEACWELYRRRTFGGLVMSLAASMLVERTERGDDMFMATFARHAQQALDLDSLSLLPAPGSAGARRPALQPRPADEGRHEPGEENLWNESWYFDFTTTETGLAGYTRLGLYPNRDEAWVTLALVRTGGPTLRYVDTAASLPDADSLRVADGDRLAADHVCKEPLRRFSVSVTAQAERFDDPAAILRDEHGREVPVALDLTWETDGQPYQYRATTRYEIPCRVWGTVTIDGETIAVDAYGQRDHSWGVRDWWSMDWVWSAGRLDDGTRVHATHVRLPGRPPIGMGYVQTPGAELEELDAMHTSETTGDAGLVEVGVIDLQSAGLELTVTPLGDGPLLMAADDGRTTHFLRSSCRFATADGRTGLGWVEWNHNQEVQR
jgi:hypothetical protein